MYLDYNIAYDAKHRWYNGAQNKNQKPSKIWNEKKAITVFGYYIWYNSLPKYLRDIGSVKTKEFKFVHGKFLELIHEDN